MKFSSSPHRPIHLYADNAWYFISASTQDHQKFLTTHDHLAIWRDTFFAITTELRIATSAWVVQPNHYHVLVQPEQGTTLGKFINRLHGKTSFLINNLDKTRGRKIWYTYWDICIRNEQQFWTRFNYIHYNPVKHGYARSPEEWEFSSYRFYLQEQGKEWLWKYLQGYPVEELLENDML